MELEDVIVFIDLALLQTAAYRHVLFNTDFLVGRQKILKRFPDPELSLLQKFWKYSIILICIEAYLLWNDVFTGDETSTHGASEKGFYVSCLIVLLEHFLLFSLLFAFIRLFGRSCPVSMRLLWKAITLSNFSKLLFIPVMIWRESSLWELGINYVLIICYSILSMICSLSGIIFFILHFPSTYLL